MLLLALAFGLLCGGALAAGGDYQSAKLRFKQRLPARPTAARIDIDYVNPADPSGKPPAVRRVVAKFARGARIDTSVPGACDATDAELMAAGTSACPADSRVGHGEATVDTGIPGPNRIVPVHIDFFNNVDQLIYLNTVKGSDARTVFRGMVEGRRVVTEAPMLPGTPPDGGAIDTVHIVLAAVTAGSGGHRRAYIRTPGRCPASGSWTNSLTFGYDNDVSQTVKNPSPCRRAG
jgi:hypothetical protein